VKVTGERLGVLFQCDFGAMQIGDNQCPWQGGDRPWRVRTGVEGRSRLWKRWNVGGVGGGVVVVVLGGFCFFLWSRRAVVEVAWGELE
jgi:hypothetical protein